MPATSRRRSVAVPVGSVTVGGNNPIVVQSMTNTDTADTPATVNQVMALAQAGSELVRITVNTDEAARAVPKIVDTLDKFGVRVPDYRRLPTTQRPSPAEEISRYARAPSPNTASIPAM